MMSIATSPWDYNAYESESLTKDEQMFIYRWYPVMGNRFCADEIGVPLHIVVTFTKELGIPSSHTNYIMTNKEIANKLGITEKEVSMIFKSAMCKLKEAFKDNLKAKQLLRDLSE
jgi:hypothetical protein